MLRDRNLVPLSRQHQHVLALCVRLDRALQTGKMELSVWQAEIHQHFDQEISIHFAAEEKELFPVAARFSELQPLVQELLNEHTVLRELFARAAHGQLDLKTLPIFVEKLAHHIRKEERQLFEGMQRVMSAEELAAVGAALDRELERTTKSCTLPKNRKD